MSIVCITFPKEYSIILGSGGFGDVLGSTADKTKVIKAIRKAKQCDDSNREYLIHKGIYEAFKIYKSVNTTIPKPYTFCEVKPPSKYVCLYEMERIFSPRKDGVQIQLSFNKDSAISTHVDQIIGRRYGEVVGKDNPPRGYFMSLDGALRKYLQKPVEKITYLMGTLLSIITIGANYNGRDVEYLLTRSVTNKYKVTVIDFGLCQKLPDDPVDAAEEIDSINSVDLYFPSVSESPVYALLSLYGFINQSLTMKLDERKRKIIINYYVSLIKRFKFEIYEISLKVYLGSLFTKQLVFFLTKMDDIFKLLYKEKKHSFTCGLLIDLLKVDLNENNAHWKMKNLSFEKIKTCYEKFKKHVVNSFREITIKFDDSPQDLLSYILKNIF